MKLTSTAFIEGDVIPQRYTGDGEDLSPPLRWNDAPEAAQCFALIVEDPDAPREEPWVHWLMYEIPGDRRSLPEGIERSSTPGAVPGAVQGVNSFPENNVGYGGPAPPPGHGRHRYYFKLYALDRSLGLGPGVDVKTLRAAMGQAGVLAEATLMGIYERK